MENRQKEELIALVRNIVNTELHNIGLLNGQWHVGKVASVVNSKMLSIYLDGSTTAQNIPCNPDVTFSAGNYVFVLFINGDSKNPFVPFKRAI